MDLRSAGHEPIVMAHMALAAAHDASAPALDFAAVYDAHFDFVWRNLRRLGVVGAGLDDAAQDVFVVVHRRLAELGDGVSIAAWLYHLSRLPAQRSGRG